MEVEDAKKARQELTIKSLNEQLKTWSRSSMSLPLHGGDGDAGDGCDKNAVAKTQTAPPNQSLEPTAGRRDEQLTTRLRSPLAQRPARRRSDFRCAKNRFDALAGAGTPQTIPLSKVPTDSGQFSLNNEATQSLRRFSCDGRLELPRCRERAFSKRLRLDHRYWRFRRQIASQLWKGPVNWEAEKLYGVERLGPFDEF
jgi:hypothetical protein